MLKLIINGGLFKRSSKAKNYRDMRKIRKGNIKDVKRNYKHIPEELIRRVTIGIDNGVWYYKDGIV